MAFHKMNFCPERYIFRNGDNICLLGTYPYKLKGPVSDAGMALSDFLTVFSQRIGLDGSCLISELGSEPLSNQETVDIRQVLPKLLGYSFTQVGNLLCFTKEQAVITEDDFLKFTENLQKENGHLYRLFYFETLNALIPCHLYIPEKRAEKAPLLLLLHGGFSNPEQPYLESDNSICSMSEKNGILLLSCDSVVFNSSYGCTTPPEGMPKGSTIFQDTPFSLLGKRLSQQCVAEEIRYFCNTFSADPQRVFVAGNSMGGMGAISLGSQIPELIAGIIPSSAAPEVDSFDYSALAEMPVFFIAGTEDDHGFEHLDRAAKKMAEICKDYTYVPVQGGTHGHCWVDVMEKWVNFINTH